MKSIMGFKIASLAVSLVLLSSLSFADVRSDNTKVNERDRATDQLTADQQMNNAGDMDITRRIRQDLVKNKRLSSYAHNIKIITTDGIVTLKGPVRSQAEKNIVVKCARRVAGTTNVEDKIEIAAKRNE